MASTDTVMHHHMRHTAGEPLRAIARDVGVHASTVMRRVSRAKEMLADPLLALAARNRAKGTAPTDHEVDLEARRILRRLKESGAVLVWSEGMATAIIALLSAGCPDAKRIAATPAAVAAEFLARGWLAPAGGGVARRYRITEAGKSALADLLGVSRRATETPLALLRRRKKLRRGGALSADDFAAAHAFRGAWERGAATSATLADMDPTLREVLVRVVVNDEGLEAVETALGLPSRCAKVLLRIALQSVAA